MVQFYNTPNAPLKHIRFLFIKLDGYSGFLRIEKIIGVRVKDISFVDKEYMSTFIKKKEKEKTMINIEKVILLQLHLLVLCHVQSISQNVC